MKRLILTPMLLAASLALASCAGFINSPEKVDMANGPTSPAAALYIVLDSLERGDVATAKQCTLYSDYVDWQQVETSYRAQPKRYRVRKILYSDPTPEQFDSSVIYYQSENGKKTIVYFTKVNGRWYWGSKIHTAFGTLTPPEESK